MTDAEKIANYVELCHRQYELSASWAGRQIDAYLIGAVDIPELRGKYLTVGQINCGAKGHHCFHAVPDSADYACACCRCALVQAPMEVNIPGTGPHGEYRHMVTLEEWKRNIGAQAVLTVKKGLTAD